jgi:hypothetical protein
MNVLLFLDDDALEIAFEAARAVNVRAVSRVDGLPTFVPDAVLSWSERIWDTVEQALRDAYRDGRRAAQSAIDAVAAKMSDAAAALGDQLVQLEQIIRQRLDTYFQSLVDAAFSRLRSTIKIGDRELIADGATIQQTIKFTGSVKAKLDEICSFVAESQLQVSVSYKGAEH